MDLPTCCYEPAVRIKVCTTNLKFGLGLIKHYYLRVPEKNLEVHSGRYRIGSHHTLSYQKRPYNVIYL